MKNWSKTCPFFLLSEAILTESASSESPAQGVAEMIATIKSLCNEELVRSVNGIFEFHLEGKEPGVWYLDLRNNAGTSINQLINVYLTNRRQFSSVYSLLLKTESLYNASRGI